MNSTIVLMTGETNGALCDKIHLNVFYILIDKFLNLPYTNPYLPMVFVFQKNVRKWDFYVFKNLSLSLIVGSYKTIIIQILLQE